MRGIIDFDAKNCIRLFNGDEEKEVCLDSAWLPLHFSKFIQDKYGYDKMKSAYLAGAVYDVSMVLSPFLGGIIVSVNFASNSPELFRTYRALIIGMEIALRPCACCCRIFSENEGFWRCSALFSPSQFLVCWPSATCSRSSLRCGWASPTQLQP